MVNGRTEMKSLNCCWRVTTKKVAIKLGKTSCLFEGGFTLRLVPALILTLKSLHGSILRALLVSILNKARALSSFCRALSFCMLCVYRPYSKLIKKSSIHESNFAVC